jgi:hypothetical protein
VGFQFYDALHVSSKSSPTGVKPGRERAFGHQCSRNHSRSFDSVVEVVNDLVGSQFYRKDIVLLDTIRLDHAKKYFKVSSVGGIFPII